MLRRLLPMAHAGLDRWGVDPADRDRLLGIIERRCLTGRNGAAWQVGRGARTAARRGRPAAALHEMLRRYIAHMHSNEPVHTWER